MKKVGWLALLPLLFMLSIVAVIMLIVFMFTTDGGSNNKGGGWGAGSISQLGEQEIPAQFIPIYKKATEKYGVPWNLLAAIHRVETVFSTADPMISSVGAEGHMQFMPCTFIGWSHPSCGGSGKGNFTDAEKTSLEVIAKYGGYGVDGDGDGKADMWNVTDAIFSTANYLAQSGASSGDIEKAIYNYNHSQEYISEVMKYATLYVDEGYDEVTIPQPGQSGFSRPIDGVVTSGFGPRVHPVTGEVGKAHEGVDLRCSAGQPIPASRAGTVIISQWQDANNHSKGYGQYVRIDHGGGYQTTYGHMSELDVHVGDKIEAGSVVGKCGSTGSSTGNHLHFEIIVNGKKTNPLPFIGG